METIGGPPQLDIVEPGIRLAFSRATDTERLRMELATTGMMAQGHLVQTVAQTLRVMGATPVAELSRWPDGTKLRVGGVIIARQRPPTAGGTAFIALEDEGLEASATGVGNVILRSEVFAAYREVLRGHFAVVEGALQWQGRVCGVVGERRSVELAGSGHDGACPTRPLHGDAVEGGSVGVVLVCKCQGVRDAAALRRARSGAHLPVLSSGNVGSGDATWGRSLRVWKAARGNSPPASPPSYT